MTRNTRSYPSEETRTRTQLARDLDKAIINLGTNDLRFVLCIALTRAMSIEELDQLIDKLEKRQKIRTSAKPPKSRNPTRRQIQHD